MLTLVHEHINHLWDETGFSLEKIRQNIVERNPDASISVSKLHRILSDPLCKLSLEDLLMLIRDGFRKDPNVLLAKIGGQEYAASEPVGYQGATALIADFERREAAIRKAYTEQLEKEAGIRKNIHAAFNEAKSAFDHSVEVIQQNHEEALKKRDDTYERSVGHLKQQLLIDADEYHKAVTAKNEQLQEMAEHAGAAMKSLKWWRFAAIITSSALAGAFAYVIWELTNLDKGATAILIQLVRDGLI